MFRGDTFEQLRAVDLAIVDKSVAVPVGGHELRTLPNLFANLGPAQPSADCGKST
jgi:hypothetical protein